MKNEEEDAMHEKTGQIGPLEGFPKEERRFAVPLTDIDYVQVRNMNRAERRAWAREHNKQFPRIGAEEVTL